MAVPPIADKDSKIQTPRRFARQRIETLVYVDLGCENGGFPINISEDGVAFQGILPLTKDQTVCVALKLPGIDGAVTATARIAWLNNSQKGGALQFIDLPQDSRILLGSWLSLQRQGGNPKESRRVIASGVVTKDLPPVPAISSQADHGKPSVKANSAVTVRSSIPALPTNEAAHATKPKVIPTFEPYVPDGGVKKRFRITALLLVLGISIIVAGVNLWQFRTFLLIHVVRSYPSQPPVPTAPAPESPLPLANPTSVELSSGLAPVAATSDADVQEIRPSPAPPDATVRPSRPAANTRAKATQSKTGKFSKVLVPLSQATRPPVAATAPALNAQPYSVPPNPVAASPNETADPQPAGARSPLPAFNPLQESAGVSGSVEIKSDPHPTVRMTPELEWRASWPGINPTYGRLSSSVEPQYPKDALRQHLAGAVRLHVVIGRSGTVEKVESTDGPALLAEAAARAVRQWHFEPTLLSGQAIETEENVTVVFRIANPNTAGN